jgi:hypothetical protein
MNWWPGKQITLQGGPHHGTVIEDMGTVAIRMGVARKSDWRGRPIVGTEVGTATYEPSKDRKVAFWLGNTWDGTCIGVYE